MFEVEAEKYEYSTPNVQETSRRRPATCLTAQYFKDTIYDNQHHYCDGTIGSEVSQYFSELTEPRETNVLAF